MAAAEGQRIQQEAKQYVLHSWSVQNAINPLPVAGAEGAVAELRRARDAGVQSPKLYCAIGHLHFELGQFSAAAASYEDELRMANDDATAHYNLAVCLEKLGEWEHADKAFQKAIEKDPRRAGAHLGRGISLLHLRQPQEARAVWRERLVLAAAQHKPVELPVEDAPDLNQ
jgi:tetratricopeptide (TPR) repeat protein